MSTSNDNSAATNMIELKSSDGVMFQVEEKVIAQSVTIKNIIDDGCGNSVIPLPNVTGNVLAKVIEYCKYHVEAAEKAKEEATLTNELKEFDAEFAKVDVNMLYDLIMAANYLDIKGLLHLIAQTVADIIKGKMPEEIRKTFNIKNDFGPGEEEEIKKENAWAFD